jgi:hypothetical protein
MSTLPEAWSSLGLVERFRKLYELAQQGSPERLQVVEWLASVRADRITAENQRRSTLVYEELYVRQHNMKTDEVAVTITANVTLNMRPLTGAGSYFMTNHFNDIIANNTINAESIVSANPNPATAIAIYEWFLSLVQVVDADPAGDGTLPASHVASWIMPVVAPAVHPTGQHEFTISVDVPTSMETAIKTKMAEQANIDLLLNQILVGAITVATVYDAASGAITVVV